MKQINIYAYNQFMNLRQTLIQSGRMIVRTGIRHHDNHGFTQSLSVLVVAAPPDARLVAPLRCTVEPLVHAPEAVQPSCIGGISVVDDAVLERERAHARPLARVRGRVGSGHGGEIGDRLHDRRHVHCVPAAPVVVFDDCLALLLLGERDVEVEVEVAAERGRPGKRPAHPALVGLERASGARDTAENVTSWFAQGGRRSRQTRPQSPSRPDIRRIVGPKHEVIDEELRASSEQIGKRRHALVGLETVLLVNSNPRQPLPPLRQFVATPRQRLLGLEQLQPGRKPIFTCSDLVVSHCFSPSCRRKSSIP